MKVTKYSLQDVIEWDVFNWSKVLNHWAPELMKYTEIGGKVLCLGERNGGLSLWFALQGFDVICSDYGGPRKEARAMHERYGVSHKIEYADVSIFEIPYADNTFDIVACKSVIGGLKLNYKDKSTRTLQNQKLAVEEVRRVLKPGGLFCGAENMRGSWLHMTARKLLKGDKIGWRHLNVAEFGELFHEFASSRFRFYGFLGTYYGKKTINKISSGIDRLLSRILPNSWLYIGFVLARK